MRKYFFSVFQTGKMFWNYLYLLVDVLHYKKISSYKIPCKFAINMGNCHVLDNNIRKLLMLPQKTLWTLTNNRLFIAQATQSSMVIIQNIFEKILLKTSTLLACELELVQFNHNIFYLNPVSRSWQTSLEQQNFFVIRGHSNNTLHFFGTF